MLLLLCRMFCSYLVWSAVCQDSLRSTVYQQKWKSKGSGNYLWQKSRNVKLDSFFMARSRMCFIFIMILPCPFSNCYLELESDRIEMSFIWIIFLQAICKYWLWSTCEGVEEVSWRRKALTFNLTSYWCIFDVMIFDK